MFVLFVYFLAAASAAPHYHHSSHGHRPFHHYDRFSEIPDFGTQEDDIFDTNRFWQQLETDLRELDSMMLSFRVHFPGVASSAGVVGSEYKVTIPLTGFDEKDIVVKARDGVLMVQAVHKTEEGNEKNYLDVRTLPLTVDVTGVWTYKDEILTIVFPLKTASTTETVGVKSDTEDVTEGIQSSWAEIEGEDADVGVQSTVARETEIKTNEIPNVEATTYAVDLKDQYEFVPVHYKK